MFVKTSFHFNNTDLRRHFESASAFNCWIYAKYNCYLYVYFDERTFDAFIVDHHIINRRNINRVLKSLLIEIKKLDFDFLYSIQGLESKLFKDLKHPNVQHQFGNKYTYSLLMI